MLPIHPNPYVDESTPGSLPRTLSRGVATGRAGEADAIEISARREFLRLAHERFLRVMSVEGDFRIGATRELDFCDGLKHWDQSQLDERKGRPCLVHDLIGPSVDQVVNDAKQSPPEPKVSPVGMGATTHTADVLQGLLRNIGNDSSADIARMTAYEHGTKIGRGWYRVHLAWETEDDTADAFTQKLVIKRIPNPFSVYPDPAADEFDYSDMRFLFLTEDLDADIFKEMYPEACSTSEEFASTGDNRKDEWYPNGAIRVAEYWRVETSRQHMAQLSDGRVLPYDQAQTAMSPSPVDNTPIPSEIVNHRMVERRTVKFAKITGSDILEETDWTGKYIPFIPVIGREIIFDRKRRLRGMIRPAMDANLTYDYMISKEAEAIGLAPISQWLVPKGALEGMEFKWADANRRAFPYLEYQYKNADGDILPPPQRINAEPAVAAITGAIMHADNNRKSTLSTYDASLGQRGPEQSGKAILAHQRESDNAHFNYRDNLARAMRFEARVLLDLAPHVYNEERLIAIYDPDGTAKQVWINKDHVDPVDGIRKFHNIGKDYNPVRYEVLLGSGPGYASRLQQGVDAMVVMSQSNPMVMQRCGDLFVRMLNVPLGDQIADRLRPPDIEQSQDGVPPTPPKIKAQLEQQAQMIQMLTKELDHRVKQAESKILEIESRERIATQGNITRILAAEVASKSAEAQLLAAHDHDAVKHELELRAGLLDSTLSVHQDAAKLELEQQKADQQAEQAKAAQQSQDQQAQLKPAAPKAA